MKDGLYLPILSIEFHKNVDHYHQDHDQEKNHLGDLLEDHPFDSQKNLSEK